MLTSYYGSKLDGSKTADGRRHDSEGLMAAHRTMPFGTVLRVTNLNNGRDVLVRVNDRGPWSPRLGLDISQAAARELNIIRAGIAPVQVEVVGDAKGRPALPGTAFYVDMGTVSGPAVNAAKDSAALQRITSVKNSAKLVDVPPLGVFTKALSDAKGRRFVGMGPFKTFLDAEKAYKRFKQHYPRARVICCTITTTAPRLVASVVADDVPESVLDYKGKTRLTAGSAGKASKNKAKVSKSRTSKTKATKTKTPKAKASKTKAKTTKAKAKTQATASAGTKNAKSTDS